MPTIKRERTHETHKKNLKQTNRLHLMMRRKGRGEEEKIFR